MNIQALDQQYKDIVKVKKNNKFAYESAVKINQDLITTAGHIHAVCLKLGLNTFYKWFIENTFIGYYYNDWRKARAVSMAHCFSIYTTLNISLKPDDCKGETFYAGVPIITQAEIEQTQAKLEKYEFIAVSEKIGPDGNYYPVDESGYFHPDQEFDDYRVGEY